MTSHGTGGAESLPPDIVTLIPFPLAARLRAVAVAATDLQVTVLMADPQDPAAVAEIEAVTGRTVHALATPTERIDALLRRLAGASTGDESWLQDRHIQSLGRLVDHSLNLGQQAQVEHLIDRALEFAPYSAELWLMKARVSRRRRDAIVALERALQSSPNDIRVLRWLQSMRELEAEDAELARAEESDVRADSTATPPVIGSDEPEIVDVEVDAGGAETPAAAVATEAQSAPATSAPVLSLVTASSPPAIGLTPDGVLQAALDFARADNLQHLLQKGADAMRGLAEAESATIFFQSGEGWHGWSTDEAVRSAISDCVPRERGLAASVLQSARPTVVDNALMRVSEVGRVVRDRRIGSFFLLPLRTNGDANGLLYLNYREPGRAPSLHESEQLTASMDLLARCVGVAAANLHERLGLIDLTAFDPVTRLYNGQQLERLLTTEIERARRYGYPLTALVIDLDEFALVNQRYGEERGDSVLRETAARLEDIARDSDVLARSRDDEFVLLLPQTSGRSAQVVARRIHRAFTDNLAIAGDLRVSVSVSIGIATFPDQASDAPSLMNAAGIAMYRAKALGKHRTATADTLNLGG